MPMSPAAEKPRLLFLRSMPRDLPDFILRHLQEQTQCLRNFFDVVEVPAEGSYRELCERHRPDLSLFESGVYTKAPRVIRDTDCFPDIPKIGFLHCDAYCPTRSVFFSDMQNAGVEVFFTLSVAMGEYTPDIADRLFVWPTGFDPGLYRDYGERKTLPVLFVGSQAPHYPWRNHIRSLLAGRYPMMTCPHFGWFNREKTEGMVHGEQYARLINSAQLVPTCGTIAKEVVRKHYEIPACRTCLVTEYTPALAAAGFVDMENCVFVDEENCIGKIDRLFASPDLMRMIADNGHRLVHERHTYAHRDQIRQWFDLHRTLRPGQKIVQPDAFSPLRIVDAASGAVNGQFHAGALDRVLLREAEAKLAAGAVGEAEALYRRCLNYHATTPEPILGLARCALRRGDAREALRLTARLIDNAMNGHGAQDPDPVQWSHFIVALLCSGDLDGATARARQYPRLRHPELDRCRAAIAALGQGAADDVLQRAEGDAARRPSVHVLPERSPGEWTADLAGLLRACGQDRLAQRLRKAPPRPSAPGGGAGGPAPARPEDATPPASRPAFVNDYGAPPSRFSRLARKLVSHGLRVLSDPAYPRKFLARRGKPDEFASLIGRIAAEADIRSALLVSDRRWSIHADALSSGSLRNPALPKVLRATSADLLPRARRGVRTPPAGDARDGAPLRRLLASNRLSDVDLVLVEAAIPPGVDLAGCVGAAKVVMIDRIDRPGNHDAFRQYLDMPDRYRLFAHNPLHQDGYAVLVSDAAYL